MKSFGKSYFVVHDSNNKLLEENNNNFNFLYLNNYEYRNKDVGSINEKTVKWIYIPVIYYAVSRWHSSFFYHLFLKEIIPFTLIVYFFTNQELSNFFVIPLSFLVFYSVYEVGGLYNDLLAHKEKDGNGTLRIKSGIKINFALFLFIRIIFAAIILLFLFNLGYCSNIYILCLGLCLVAYIIHSLIKNNLRIVTFFLLKIFRKAVPLLVLVNSVNNNIFINIFLSFFLFDAPSEIYFYFLKRRNKVQLKKVRSFKVKLFLFEFLLALIIWIYFSMPIYFIVVVYFLILNIFNYLFVKEKNII
jgi:hypothetical protein